MNNQRKIPDHPHRKIRKMLKMLTFSPCESDNLEHAKAIKCCDAVSLFALHFTPERMSFIKLFIIYVICIFIHSGRIPKGTNQVKGKVRTYVAHISPFPSFFPFETPFPYPFLSNRVHHTKPEGEALPFMMRNAK